MDPADVKKDDQKAKLLALFERIPIFSGLNVEERTDILRLCSKVSLEQGGTLCRQGEASDSMFILLFGKLAVRIDDATTVATIDPITSIGEMGVFTAAPRTATVEAMERSALLRLGAEDLNRLIESRPSLGVAVMRKVISILSERVTADNVRIREFQNYIFEK